MMYEILAPGGLLLNADLFSYADAAMSRTTLEFDLTWMKYKFASSSDEVTNGTPPARRQLLLKKWIEHYRTANRLEPLEDGRRSPGHLSMLRTAGFKRAAVPYRLSLSGIVLAEK